MRGWHMTLANYRELVSFCCDLLIAARIAESSRVNADGSAEIIMTGLGRRVGDDLAILLRAADDDMVRSVLQMLLEGKKSDVEPESFADASSRYRR